MKTIGIIAAIAALLVTASVADARTRYYGNGSSAYPQYDHAGGPSYGGM